MCDADSYATGLLLTQISVGLLTSVLINSAAKSIQQPMPEARAVPVPEASYENQDNEPQNSEPTVPAVAAAPAAVEKVGQSLRRRAVEHTRTKDSVTIKVDLDTARNMKFNF